MTFTAEDARTWLTLIMSGIALAGVIWGWFQARSKDNSEKIEGLVKAVAEQGGELIAIRHEIDHMPSQDTVHKLELSIAEMKGDISTIGKSMEGIQRTSIRIENHLLGK